MASVEWSDDALDDLDDLDAIVARKIAAKVLWFGEHFDEVLTRKLHHDLRKLCKLRVGDYRVIYFLQEGHGQKVMVEAVKHRSEAYD
ncbi:MAG: type II toxin-antitoxin system RelE/ParE family toxin [Patescibacteria group bacterium]